MSKKITAWSGRAYTWSLISYAKPSEFERILKEAKHFAYCYHDKDETITEDGEQKLKEPHTHILITFEKWISLEQIQKIIASEQNTLGECRRKCGDTWVNLNIGALFQYLIHENDPDKYQYDRECRITDGTDYWRRFDSAITDISNNEQFLSDLLGAYKTESEFDMFMAKKYGKDYIKNRLYYKEFRFENITNEIYLELHNRYDNLISFLISEDITENKAIMYIKDRLKFERGFYNE